MQKVPITSATNLPLAIVGGGIAGLALARACSRRGIECAVLEQAPQLRAVGSGILLGMNAYRVLIELGIAEATLEHSVTVDRAELRNSHGKLLASIPLGSIGSRLGLKTIVCHRAHLQSVLAASLPSKILHTGWTAKSIELLGGHAVVTSQSGQSVRANLIAGCDGIHGVSRGMVTPHRKPRYSGSTCWRAILNTPGHSTVDYGTMTEYIGPRCRFGAAWIDSGKIGWYLTTYSPEGLHDTPGELCNRLTALVSGWSPSVCDLIQSTPAEQILRNDLLDLPVPSTLYRARVVLLGDSAHAMLPNLGQGGATAFEDATSLAYHLAHAHDIKSALGNYQYARHNRCRITQALSRLYGTIFQRPTDLECVVRDTLLSLTPKQLIACGYTSAITGKLPFWQ